MAALEGSKLSGDATGRKDELAAAEKEDTSGASKSPEPLPKKTLLSLPDELLSTICGHLHNDADCSDLQLSVKRFYPLCKPWIWREVILDEDFETHDTFMCHLVRTSLSALVRIMTYNITSPFSKMSAHLLSTNFTNLTDLTLSPHCGDDEDDDEEGKSLPKTTTIALKALLALRSLKLKGFLEIEDATFSVCTDLPHLHFLNATSLILAESLFKDRPALRSLEVRLNDFGCAAIIACAETLHSLILVRDRNEEQGSLAQNKCLNQLRLLFDPMRNKRRDLPLQSLTLEWFELLETRDNIVRPHPRLVEFLSALKGTSLSTLRIKRFSKVKCSANDDPGFGLFLPSVQNLELALLPGHPETSALDHDSILLLRALLRCFPNAARLALANWLTPLDPQMLATHALLELGIYSPIFYLLLEPLRRTALLEIKLEGGWLLWDGKLVHLLRDDDGFVRELVWTD